MTSGLAYLAASKTLLDRWVFDGGFMMVFLVPTSLLALGYVLQGFINLRRGRILSRRLLDSCRELARQGDRAAIERLLASARDTAMKRILLRGLTAPRIPSSEDLVNLIRDEIARLFRSINGLAVIFNVAPYMGILGTVLGLMQTFSNYASKANPSITDLGTGLNQALITTIWGLGIAIPVYVFYHHFRTRLIRYEEDLLPDALAGVVDELRTAARHGPDQSNMITRLTYGLDEEESAAETPPPDESSPGERRKTRPPTGDDEDSRPAHRTKASRAPRRGDRTTETHPPIPEVDARGTHPETPTEEIKLP